MHHKFKKVDFGKECFSEAFADYAQSLFGMDVVDQQVQSSPWQLSLVGICSYSILLLKKKFKKMTKML